MTTAPKTTRNPGKLAVLGIVLLAVGMAGFAWWWNWQRTVRCREFYGGEGAHLIRTATQVEGLVGSDVYRSGSGRFKELRFGPHYFTVSRTQDLSSAQGLIHARTALLDDSSYQWDAAPLSNCDPLMLNGVQFREGDRHLTLIFVYNCRGLWIVETEKYVVLEPKIAEGWKSFLMRHLHPIDPDKPPLLLPTK